MNLTAKKRAEGAKGKIKQIRREGNIPAVFYSPGSPAQSIEIDGLQFNTALRKIKSGRLATTVFTLELEGGKNQVIVKDIQYDLTSYKVIHLDFEELKKDIPVRIKVPIECVGVEECVGIKLGGFMRQVIRNVKVECLPKNIPHEFQMDISGLSIKQSKRLSEISKPEGIKFLTTTDEVVVVIAKR